LEQAPIIVVPCHRDVRSHDLSFPEYIVYKDEKFSFEKFLSIPTTMDGIKSFWWKERCCYLGPQYTVGLLLACVVCENDPVFKIPYPR